MEKIILTEQEMNSLFDEKAAAMLKDESRIKVYGIEGLSVGDKFTITPNEAGQVIVAGEYNSTDFLRVLCTGDRANISMTALLGTSKPNKYFNSDGYKPEFMDGYTAEKAIAEAWKPESRIEKEIAPTIAKNYVGATFTCIASCQYAAIIQEVERPMTTYLFKCEMPK